MTVLAPIDRDPGTEDVIETAEEQASGLGEDLVFLHVTSEGDDRGEARAAVEETIEGVLGSLEGVEVRVAEAMSQRDTPSGRTTARVLDVADEVDARYIVVGSQKQTPVGKFVLGSVARAVLVNADVPVVIVEQRKSDEDGGESRDRDNPSPRM